MQSVGTCLICRLPSTSQADHLRTVNALTVNSGQICFAATRVYVQSGIYDKFIEAYKVALSEKLKVLGNPEQDGIQIGPVVDKAQYDRILSFINNAVDKKEGTLIAGGAAQGSKVWEAKLPTPQRLTADSSRATSSSRPCSPTPPPTLPSTKTRSSALSPSSTSSRRSRRLSTAPTTACTA